MFIVFTVSPYRFVSTETVYGLIYITSLIINNLLIHQSFYDPS